MLKPFYKGQRSWQGGHTTLETINTLPYDSVHGLATTHIDTCLICRRWQDLDWEGGQGQWTGRETGICYTVCQYSLWGALIISTCKRWSQKSTKNYFMQLMVNLMHKGCSLEDISSSQPFLCQCLTDQCILKLLVPPSLLCYCQLNTCSGCCNIPFSHLTHTWSSPLLSSAFLSCQELQQLEQPLEKKYLQQNHTHPTFWQTNQLSFERLLKLLQRSALAEDHVASFHLHVPAAPKGDYVEAGQSLLLRLQWEY